MEINNYKTHLLYFSPTGTTKRVLEAIADGLGTSIKHHSLTLPQDREALPHFKKNDLVILGLPVYSGRIPSIIEPFINKISGEQTPIVLVAVYGNRDIDDALIEMHDIVSSNNFKPIAGAAFIGEHSYTPLTATGRPDTSDVSKAGTFGKDITHLLKTQAIGTLELQVRGTRPYKEIKENPPLGPTIFDTCSKCGKCIKNCPSGALSMTDKVLVDESLCILCHKCMKDCPEEAIDFGGRLPKVRAFIHEHLTERKEPEIFLGQ